MIAVLYEDQRGLPTREFGPHRLAIQCVIDDADGDHWKVDKRFNPVPKNGVGKLLDACANDVHLFAPRGEPMIVLVDDDKIRRELKLSKGAADEDVTKAIKKRAPYARLEVFLLKENMESVVTAVRECARLPPLPKKKPNPDERDAELSRATKATETELRKCVRGKVPSFDAFVARLVKVLRDDPDPAS